MTKLLEQAIAKLRDLPQTEQDRAAEALLHFAEVAKQDGVYHFSDAERVALAESKAAVRRGEFATEAEVEAAFAQFRA